MAIPEQVKVACPLDEEKVDVTIFYASYGTPNKAKIATGAFCAKGQARGCDPEGCRELKRFGL